MGVLYLPVLATLMAGAPRGAAPQEPVRAQVATDSTGPARARALRDQAQRLEREAAGLRRQAAALERDAERIRATQQNAVDAARSAQQGMPGSPFARQAQLDVVTRGNAAETSASRAARARDRAERLYLRAAGLREQADRAERAGA